MTAPLPTGRSEVGYDQPGGGTGTVVMVLPDGVDDPHRPSGGNRFDRRVATELRALGWSVLERVVPGAWPYPDEAARARLSAALAARGSAPGRAVLLVDGLIASGAGDLVAVAAGDGPVVVLLHMPFGQVDPSLEGGEHLMLTRAAAVVATSEWSRRHLLERYRLPADRVHVAPPGVDPVPGVPDGAADASGRPAEDEVGASGSRLLCVAAVTPAKGLDVLVAALAGLAGPTASAQTPEPRKPGWHCTCVGSLEVDPGFVAQLRAAIDSAGLTGRVHLTGALDRGALEAAYAASDLLVLPSRTESWGMAVTEALAHAIPVVASDVGGVREALGAAPDGRRPGLLVQAGDDHVLAATLRRWLTESDLRARLRAAAWARRSQLTGWDQTAAQLSAVLTGALGESVTSGTGRR